MDIPGLAKFHIYMCMIKNQIKLNVFKCYKICKCISPTISGNLLSTLEKRCRFPKLCKVVKVVTIFIIRS